MTNPPQQPGPTDGFGEPTVRRVPPPHNPAPPSNQGSSNPPHHGQWGSGPTQPETGSPPRGPGDVAHQGQQWGPGSQQWGPGQQQPQYQPAQSAGFAQPGPWPGQGAGLGGPPTGALGTYSSSPFGGQQPRFTQRGFRNQWRQDAGPGQSPYGQAPAPGQGGYSGQPGYFQQPGPYQQPPGYFAPSPSQQGYPPLSQQPYGQWPQQRRRRSSLLPPVIITVVALIVVVALLNGLLGGNRGGGSGYQNEGYQLPEYTSSKPELPKPATPSDAEKLTRENTFYQQTVASPVRCELQGMDATSASEQELKAQLDKQQDCLLRVWGPTIEAAGYTPVRSKITVYSQAGYSPCGKLPMSNAVYCSLDQNIYVATNVTDIMGNRAKDHWVMETIMAHEYAHNVQGRTGIIGGRNLLAKDADNESEAKLLVRRNEAQADCLAGMFFNSTAQSLNLSEADKATIIATFRSFGSDRTGSTKESTHPTMVIREAWAKKGMNSLEVKTCNTYIVPKEQVA